MPAPSRPTIAFLAVAALLAVPGTAAQSVGEVQSWTDPDELTVEGWRDQFFTVYFEGRIECTPGLSAPPPVRLVPDSNNITGQQGGETNIYFAVEPHEIVIDWIPQGNGVFVLEGAQRMDVTAEAAPPADLDREIRFRDVQAYDRGGTVCNASGFGWDVDAAPIFVEIPCHCLPQGSTTTDSTATEDDNDTPVPAWLPLAAVLGAFLLLRRRA